jgi:hypothetical protein
MRFRLRLYLIDKVVLAMFVSTFCILSRLLFRQLLRLIRLACPSVSPGALLAALFVSAVAHPIWWMFDQKALLEQEHDRALVGIWVFVQRIQVPEPDLQHPAEEARDNVKVGF